MARFDVYKNRSGSGYLLDVQTDLISQLSTRVVVPLLPVDIAPSPAKRLNPIFDVLGIDTAMLTQFMATVPVAELGSPVASLHHKGDEVLAAVGFLHQGW